MIAEVCQHCGAERPHWHGGSHYRWCATHKAHGHRACCAGETAEEDWQEHNGYVPRPSRC